MKNFEEDKDWKIEVLKREVIRREEKLKEIIDEIEKDCNKKYSKDKPASYAFFRGYNKCKKQVIDIIKKRLI